VGSRRRKFDGIEKAPMSPKQPWVDGRVDVLLASLHEFGLSVSRSAAADLFHERVRWVSAQMGISPATAQRYLTDQALTELAHTMAFTFVEETPGADIIAAPRTIGVPVPVVGRCIAGLAEAIHVRLRERDDVDHLRVTVAQLAHALSALGQIAATEPDTDRPAAHPMMIMMPAGLVHRAARYLDAAADLASAGTLPDGVDPADSDELAAAFQDDAASLRNCLNQ